MVVCFILKLDAGGAIFAVAFSLLVSRKNAAIRAKVALSSAQRIVASGKMIAPKAHHSAAAQVTPASPATPAR